MKKKFVPNMVRELHKFLFSLSYTYFEHNEQIKISQHSYPLLNF